MLKRSLSPTPHNHTMSTHTQTQTQTESESEIKYEEKKQLAQICLDGKFRMEVWFDHASGRITVKEDDGSSRSYDGKAQVNATLRCILADFYVEKTRLYPKQRTAQLADQLTLGNGIGSKDWQWFASRDTGFQLDLISRCHCSHDEEFSTEDELEEYRYKKWLDKTEQEEEQRGYGF